MKHKLLSLATALGFGLVLAQSVHAQTSLPTDHEAPAEAAVMLPPQELTAHKLFLLLLAEVAGARGEVNVSLDAYLQLAQETRDPRIARRATEIALFSRDMEAAAVAARIWADTDPGSEDARRILTGVLATSEERLSEVQMQLARILATSEHGQLEQNLLGLNRALARVPDKNAVRSIIERLVEPYHDQPAAHFARAQAAANVDDIPAALDALDQALELRPDWEPVIALKIQLLAQQGYMHRAREVAEDYLERHPDNRNIGVAYARTLVSLEEFEAALTQFRQLLESRPDDQDLMYAVALLSAQLEDLERAETYFERALEAGYHDADDIRMNLGHISERLDNSTEALNWYRGVRPGQHYFDAQIRIANVLAEKGDLTEARRHLKTVQVVGEERQRVLFAEVLLLRNAGEYAEALQVVDQALREDPDNVDLLYESALLAERLDMMAVTESRLRRLIEIDPEHAHAYNALGYTLADRGERLSEAESLIETALELAPDDPFILDSMGWVRFRKNDLEGALEYLERAYALRPDPEIAAHLGEVLWKLDRASEAHRVWDEALDQHPENDALNETVERLRAQ